MGADISVRNRSTSGGEPVADLGVKASELDAVQVKGEAVVRAIDEFPIWVVAASQTSGRSVLSEASELRVKEVDRIAMVAVEMAKMGANIDEFEDGLSVVGPVRLAGGEVDSHGDHRLGMALAIAGLVSMKSTVVDNAECISDSFPLFVETMRAIGADMRWME